MFEVWCFQIWVYIVRSWVIIHSLVVSEASIMLESFVCRMERHCIFSDWILVIHLSSIWPHVVASIYNRPRHTNVLWWKVGVFLVSLASLEEVVSLSDGHLLPFLPVVVISLDLIIESRWVVSSLATVSIDKYVTHFLELLFKLYIINKQNKIKFIDQ